MPTPTDAGPSMELPRWPGYRPPRLCVVCQAMLHPAASNAVAAADPYPVCHAVACRMVVSRRPDMGEAGFRHYLQMEARRRQHIAAVTAAALARKQAESAENAAGWLALRARLGAAESQALQLLLPSGPRRARPLAARRRQRYLSHLTRIIAEAGALDSTAAVPAAAVDPATSALPGRLCGLCGGGCCTRGGESAYLSAATMRRFMDQHPLWSGAQVIQAYMARLAQQTQAGSCINHTRNGCSLPREMRSDICNRFSCESLARLQAAQRAPGAVQLVVLVLRRQQDHWHRAQAGVDNEINASAMLRESGSARVKLPLRS